MTSIFMRLCDKAVLFMCCTAAYLVQPELGRSVMPILVALAFASLLSYFEKEPARLALTAAFLVWSAFVPALVFFLPLNLYDVLFTRRWYVCLAAFVPFTLFFRAATPEARVSASVLLAFGVWLRYRSGALETLKTERNELRDSAKELSLRLERQNRELLKQQDAEVNVAMLGERSRIAREIHDSVGHLLSSSILQVGALLAVNRNETVRTGLVTLKDTLNEAMDSIRRSVHDLHDESVDLYGQLYRLAQSFSFCPLDFQYELETDPPPKLKYAFLAIVKEGLANIMRHSNATQASVTLREHPAFYQLIISDNGTGISHDTGSGGMGLANIRERVDSFHGVMNISADSGFRIFITVPKGETHP